MHSIQNKFTMLVLSCILLSATALGGIGVLYAAQLIDEDSEEIMELTCREQRSEMDMIFKGIEDAVNMISVYAEEEISDVEKFSEDSEYRRAYIGSLESMFGSVARNADGAVAYYIRFNPEISTATEGFFYTRQKRESRFRKYPNTDLAAYDPDDTEHVGWWYIPVEKGGPVWLEPYWNKNTESYIISYEVPLYKDGMLLGVAGMDIDFQAVEGWLDRIDVYQNGTAFLSDSKGNVLYTTSDTSEEEMSAIMKPSAPLREKKTVMYTLRNGMQLGMEIPIHEINKKKYTLINHLCMIVLGLSALFSVLTVLLSRRLVRPLRELTAAAEKVADGDLEIELKCNTRDEVYLLTKSIQKMIVHLREYLTYINELAYTDSLTGVKNKTAYQEVVERKKMEMSAGMAEFALIVMDVNGLKQVNDRFGHEEGDRLLKDASKLIEKVFINSPVYRIGGDEFVVLLEDEDYRNASRRLDTLEQAMRETGTGIRTRVSIAWGMAVYDGQNEESYERLFHRADKAMYERKARMKKGWSENAETV